MTSAFHRYRTYAVLEVGRRVLHYIFTCGTNKPPNVFFDEYLRNLPNTSAANYLKMNSKSKKFDKTELGQIRGDPTCASFDISLLCKAINFACEGLELAEMNPRNDLEHYILQIKDWRNECHHGPHEITFRDYQQTSNRLKTLYHDALRAAGQRYNLTTVQVNAEVDKVDRELDKIGNEILGEADLLIYCGPQMKMDLINEADAKLRENLKAACSINPVSFLTGMNLDIDIHDVFTEIRVKEGNRGEDGAVMSHKDIVSIARAKPGCTGPQVLLVEGLAGSGKTTFMTKVGAEWLKDRQQRTITGLDHYSLLLRVQCRDRGVTSLEELLKVMVPEVFVKFRGLLLPLFRTCSVLFLIDGLDEANPDSTNLVASILQCMRCVMDCTLLFTSRPERISDFERGIPSDYKKTYVELLGVAEDQRESFVQCYHHEIQLKIGGTQNTTEFLKKVKGLLLLEHFRLPLNMMLLTWVCLKRPDVIATSMTQTQLYQSSYELCVERLVDRVTPRIASSEQVLRSSLKECLKMLQKECLLALSDLQLSVEGEAEDHIRTACETRGVPADDVLSSFLSLRITKSVLGILEKQYLVPHKGLQEFYAALYVVSHPCLSTTSGGIKVVVQNTLGTSDLHLLHFQNMFRYVAGLLHQPSRRMSDKLSKEAVDLLWESGMKSREQWLDLVEETKAAPPILNCVVKYFPLNYPLNISDSRMWSYTVLLPNLPPSSVTINLKWDLAGKEAELGALINALNNHVCTELQLYHHYQHPDPFLYSDKILQDVLPRSDLKVFTGHLSAAGVAQLPEGFSDLELALTNNTHACRVVRHLYQRRMWALRIHVPVADIMPEPLIPLPPARDVHLYLTGVTESLTTKAAHLAAALQPPQGYWCVWLPQATMGAADWGGLLGAMNDAGVGVQWRVLVPKNSVTEDEEAYLVTISQSRLGCSFGTNSFDGW